MRNRPPYALRSVDNALHLATILQREGSIRVTDAAERLGVAESTAHRLLSTLVYRDFAVHGEDRRYHSGPVLTHDALIDAPVEMLRRVAMPGLRMLVDRTGESANVMVRIGAVVRIIATVETEKAVRVGDRAGRELPAHLASGGRAMLADLPREELAAVLDGAVPAVDLPRLARALSAVRRQGYAINAQLTETGLTAVGMAVRDETSTAVGALSVSMPSARYSRERLGEITDALATAVGNIEDQLFRKAE